MMVNEADERAEICIEIDNEFEITIKISFITIEISNGATGKHTILYKCKNH